MSETTAIEWADSTFNPWIGCTRVSPACDDCYAARSTPARTLGVIWGAHEPRRRTGDANWKSPMQWERRAAEFQAQHGRRRRVFCASLADVFDNAVPPSWREELFELIRVTPNLDWLLLTKRPQNIVKMVRESGVPAGATRYLPTNAWLGTTAEDQKRANHNVIHLLRAKKALGARVAFLSVEPMLEAICLWKLTEGDYEEDSLGAEVYPLRGLYAVPDCDWEGPKLDWVICGGESGPRARPMRAAWAQDLRDQCAAAGVPFLFKQWGEWLGEKQDGHSEHRPMELNATDDPIRVGKKAAGRSLDGVEHNGFPEVRS